MRSKTGKSEGERVMQKANAKSLKRNMVVKLFPDELAVIMSDPAYIKSVLGEVTSLSRDRIVFHVLTSTGIMKYIDHGDITNVPVPEEDWHSITAKAIEAFAGRSTREQEPRKGKRQTHERILSGLIIALDGRQNLITIEVPSGAVDGLMTGASATLSIEPSKG
jgi:hypothetical protein